MLRSFERRLNQLEERIHPQPRGLTLEEREDLMKQIRQTIADAGIVQGPNQSLAEAFAR